MAEKLRNEMRAEMEDRFLKYLEFWADHCTDYENGGYFATCFDEDENRVNYDAVKDDVSNGRMLYAFSDSARLLSSVTSQGERTLRVQEKCRKAAENGYRFTRKYFLDPEYGWFYRAVNRDGSVCDDGKSTYGGSFFLLGMIAYYELTGDEECLETIKKIFWTSEEKMTDLVYGGYFAHFSRELAVTPEKNAVFADEKLLTSQQHMLETLSRLYRIWPDETVRARGIATARLMNTAFIFKEMNGYTQRTDRSYTNQEKDNLLGDLAENIWLFPTAGKVFGDEELNRELLDVADTLYKYAEEAAFDYEKGGCYDRIVDGTLSKDKVWWNMAELMNMEYLRNPDGELMKKTWQFIRDNMIRESGIWVWSTDEAGNVNEWLGDTVPITDGYHIVRMFLNFLSE